MKYFIQFVFIAIFFVACSKEKDNKFNWQIIDNNGNELAVVQNKTEAELVACLTDGSCGSLNGGSITSCNYYKVTDPTFCWNINGQIIGPYPQKISDCFGHWPESSKLPGICTENPCEKWFTRYKRTHKSSGRLAYSNIQSKNYCNTDTLALFRNSNPIIIKDDADSLVLWQRSKTGSDFY